VIEEIAVSLPFSDMQCTGTSNLQPRGETRRTNAGQPGKACERYCRGDRGAIRAPGGSFDTVNELQMLVKNQKRENCLVSGSVEIELPLAH